MLFVDHLETGYYPSGVSDLSWGRDLSHLVGLPCGGVDQHETGKLADKLGIVTFKNLINKESAFNETCQTCQQRLFKIHG